MQDRRPESVTNGWGAGRGAVGGCGSRHLGALGRRLPLYEAGVSMELAGRGGGESGRI